MHNIGMISFKYADQPPDQILEGYIPQFPIIFFFFFFFNFKIYVFGASWNNKYLINTWLSKLMPSVTVQAEASQM